MATTHNTRTAPYRGTQLQGITDLTVLAKIKTGLVPDIADTLTYSDRLQRVLVTLDTLQRIGRESEQQASPFPDSIGRFRGIHFFRFAILPAELKIGESAQSDQLLLNVTFDGGWEPYMRTIWGPLGTLLDLIFCHCEDYPLASLCHFNDYMRWVRRFEVPSQFFYADSAATVADRHFYTELSALQRSSGHKPDADRRAAGLALPVQPPTPIPSPYAAQSSLRGLRALHDLQPAFPKNADEKEDDAGVLLRFAQHVSSYLRDWVSKGEFDPGGRYGDLRPAFKADIEWLMQPRFKRGLGPALPALVMSSVQAGIALPLPRKASQGVLAMFRVTDPVEAKRWLTTVPVTREGEKPADDIYRNLAITFSGLKKLGVPESQLAQLPQEFIDGMEARAGVLGDLRQNHPAHWRRPVLVGGISLELGAVHLLLQLRTVFLPNEAGAGDGVHPRLQQELDLLGSGQGLQLLATQPMFLSQSSDTSPGRDHFGFVDGLSQPTLGSPTGAALRFSDQVKEGDLFLGYPSQRDTAVAATVDPLFLKDGSFLVVRKLRIHLERLDQALEAAVAGAPALGIDKAALGDELKARMMGRRQDGRPLVQEAGIGAPLGNDFDFREDPRGEECPHASHVRRLNPRETQAGLPLPRIARRGMSYGTLRPSGEAAHVNDDRGTMFMAYNASIAEQFEVLQRWVSGGNASGISSADSDPFLGLPEPGKSRVFRCLVNDHVVRVDLGREPIVTLQWGLYAFAPSPDVLAKWSPAPASQPRSAQESGNAQGGEKRVESQQDNKERWRAQVEAMNMREATWQTVQRAASGEVSAGEYGQLVGKAAEVTRILRDDGKNYSTCGYGKRLEASLGPGFLGQDRAGPHSGHELYGPAVNEVIWNFRDEGGAFADAFGTAGTVLQRLRSDAARTGSAQVPIDLESFGGEVLGLLCHQWFGLPDKDGAYMVIGKGNDDHPAAASNEVPTCPGHFVRVSRFVFTTPHPNTRTRQLGEKQGKAIGQAVAAWLANTEANPQQRGQLSQDILKFLPADPETRASTLAGVMLGFPPTVLGNLVGVLARWAAGGVLWDLQFGVREWQRQLNEIKPRPGIEHPIWNIPVGALTGPLLETMALSPVPYAIWRTEAAGDRTHGDERRNVVLGLGAAVQDPDVAHMEAGDRADNRMLMFGGRFGSKDAPVHACSGYRMAIGVILGTAAALMVAGTLRRDASPTSLLLIPD